MFRQLLALGAIAISSVAAACDCVMMRPGDPHFAEDVARVADGATVVADGYFVAPAASPMGPAEFVVTHVYKGSPGGRVTLRVESDCGLMLDHVPTGPKNAILLTIFGAPGHYEASRCSNLLGAGFEQALRGRLNKDCTAH